MKIINHLKYCRPLGREVLVLVFKYQQTFQRSYCLHLQGRGCKAAGPCDTLVVQRVPFTAGPSTAQQRRYRSLGSSDTTRSLAGSPAIKETI